MTQKHRAEMLASVSDKLMATSHETGLVLHSLHSRGELRTALNNLEIYGIAAGLVFWLVAVDNERIRSQSEKLITAAKAYHAKYGRTYPDETYTMV